MQKTILVTGGAGFIGSNFVLFFAKKYPEYKIVNLDALTYAGSLSNLHPNDLRNHEFIHGNILDESLLSIIFEKFKFQGVIHFAAESHVDNSIKNSKLFYRVNVDGTANLLDAANSLWMNGPHLIRPGYEKARFHLVSTDEVYGSLDFGTELFKETTPYDPSSPYSASKAGADHAARAAHRTLGMNVTISNCSNNYGPKQHPEKLIPKIIQNCLTEQPIPIYGRGENIRDWLYVDDHCAGIDLIFHNGIAGETYNIGGRNERTNMQIVGKICEIMNQKVPRENGAKYEDLITFVADRAGHDLRYAIDATKIETELGWRAKENFDTGILKTVDWYLQKLR